MGLALVALGLGLARIDQVGLWYDEAYTARIASLSPERIWRGAIADIHPPGWPLVSALALRSPLPAEVALRLPSLLAFVALVGSVAARAPLLGLAMLGAAPLMDQATQGRPYMLLAAGLVAVAELLRLGRWGLGGLAAGAVASLHALGGALAAPVVLIQLAVYRPGRAALGRLIAGGAVLSLPWLPAFVERARSYAANPWYQPADAGAWWTVSDGWTGLLGLTVWLASRVRSGWRGLAPGLGVLLVLGLLEVAGLGVEIRKTGVVVLPLLLAGEAAVEPVQAATWRWIGALALAVGLFAGSVTIDARPDLREAARAVEALGPDVPVIAVFASETAWYLRGPAPLPSRRDPDGIRTRLVEVLEASGRPCVVALSLPGTFPTEETLPQGVRTRAVSDVTGLDVRLMGEGSCRVGEGAVGWRASPQLTR